MSSRSVRDSGQRHSAVGTGRAHGKTILLGEHTVVYGLPAIAIPVPELQVEAFARVRSAATDSVDAQNPMVSLDGGTRVPIESIRSDFPESSHRVAVREALSRWQLADDIVDVVLHSAIPPARGLGSSAACAVAAVRALADLYETAADTQAVYEIVQCGEQFAHGRASGVDTRTAMSSEPIWFHRGAARRLVVGLDATVIIADTGVPGSTHHAVEAVAAALHDDSDNARQLLVRARAITESGARQLAEGRAVELGRSLVQFHSVLSDLGVSTPEIERLIAAALDAGALGAKLTGGGLGGCILALVDATDIERTRAALVAAGAVQTWLIRLRGRSI